MTGKLKSIAKFLLFFGLGVGLLVLAFVNLNLNYEALLDGFRNANYFWIFMAVTVSLSSHLVRALRWNLMLEPLGKKPSGMNAFNAVMIGYLFNFAIPRMGEVSRCGILNRTDRIPMHESLGTVVVERVFDMLILLALTAGVLVIEFDTLYSFFSETFFTPLEEKIAGFPAAYGVIALLILLLVGYLVYRSRVHLLQMTLIAKIVNLIRGFGNGFASVFKLKSPGMFFLQTALIWGLYFLNTYCYLMAIDETSHIGISAAMSILVVGTFGFAAPVSGGIGAYHIFVAKGLALYGVSSLGGGVFGFVSHGMQMLMILAVGTFSLIYTFIQERKQLSKEA
ncbi:MAG: lysylphosphatidylglycerol synthase transmembrane domain-containing protein [Bacteroidia bacterium]